MKTINPSPRAWKTDRSRSPLSTLPPLLLLLRRQLFQRDSISEYDGRQYREYLLGLPIIPILPSNGVSGKTGAVREECNGVD